MTGLNSGKSDRYTSRVVVLPADERNIGSSGEANVGDTVPSDGVASIELTSYHISRTIVLL